MLSPREQIMLNYFNRRGQVITLDELLMKFRRSGDKAIIHSVILSLEEHALIDEVPHKEEWVISDYGRLIHSQPVELLQKT
jgi:hypothetical protein